MSGGGFILLHRRIFDHHLFDREPFTEREAWIWLLCQASYQPHRMRYHSRIIEVDRGEVPTSYRKLVERWKWGIHRVRRFLDLLESEGMITRKTATGFVVISICRYDEFQTTLRESATHPATVSATHPATVSATNINKGNTGKEEKEASEQQEESPHEPEGDALAAAADDLLRAFEEVLESLTGQPRARRRADDPQHALRFAEWGMSVEEFEKLCRNRISAAIRSGGDLPGGMGYFSKAVLEITSRPGHHAPAAAKPKPPAAPMDALSEVLHAELRTMVDAPTYSSWLAPLRVVAMPNGDATLRLRAPSGFVAEMVATRHERELLAAAVKAGWHADHVAVISPQAEAA